MKILALSLLAAALSSSAFAQPSPQATEADRSTPAAIGPTPAYSLKPAARAALANGLSLSLIESHRLPLVAVTLVIPRASDATDPAGQEGLSDFVAEMVKEGVPGLPSAAALADAIDDLGASLSVAAGNSGLTVSITVLKKNIDKALALAASMVREPSYLAGGDRYQKALERLRQRSLSDLEMEKGDPSALAGKRLSASLFGDGPHGRSATETSLKAITLASVAARQRGAVAPEGAVLAVAGDVTMEELKALAAKNFGAWTPALQPAVAAPRGVETSPAPAASPTGLVIELIDMPGEQAEMMLGLKTLPRLHPDHDALSLAVAVLGGSFISRLNQNIRETHHWAYGASASLSAWKDAGVVEMQTKVQVDKTGDALREVLAEVARLAAEPVPDAELLATKTFLKGAYLRNNRTVQNLSARLAAIETLGLSPNTLTDYAARMDALTPAQVQAAAETWLGAAGLKIVIAGPADLILPQLKGAGTVRVLDPNGREKLSSAAWPASSSSMTTSKSSPS